tara:strand:+ start:1346 stop:1510 length:165 start_codon:yes stop_codon:yes gene_type:complete
MTTKPKYKNNFKIIKIKLNPNKIIRSKSYFVGPGGTTYGHKTTSTRVGDMYKKD